MDRGVLLVLLCLQAFLLITAFTSTDAAALVKDDQQQQSTELVKRFRLPKHPAEEVVLKTRGCADLPGGCGFLVKRGTPQQTEAKEEEKKTAGKEGQERKGGCRRRPGACIGLDQ